MPEKLGLIKLAAVKDRVRTRVEPFETRAKNCLTCETQGACCLDAHFVNVAITRLEAVAMNAAIASLGDRKRAAVNLRIDESIERFGLRENPDGLKRTYSCPLFEKGVGCLVHEVKPTACIVHACYESPDDLPPDEILSAAETEIERIDRMVYHGSNAAKPIPLFLADIRKP
jgi:Fe-S-cluster containining protein